MDECKYDACAIAAPPLKLPSWKHTYLQLNYYATKHCSGMYYIIDAAGSGTSATACSTVGVTYKGQLTSGTVFDQGTTSFQLDQVIAAWTKG
jgi:FKBP-type peptidyl-prolyl cis-trans isomerase FkpA